MQYYPKEVVMQGVELSYLNACVRAVIDSYLNLMKLTVREALLEVHYGKSDTTGLDATAESILIKRMREFDRRAIFLTEESQKKDIERWLFSYDPEQQPDVFFSDPIDRTKYFLKFIAVGLGIKLEVAKEDKVELIDLLKLMDERFPQNLNVEDLLRMTDATKIWEQMIDNPPASITGPTTSITYLKKGRLIFSVILNYITSEIVVASDAGIKSFKINPKHQDVCRLTSKDIYKKGRDIGFLSWPYPSKNEDDLRFVTFLGKSNYKENFEASNIINPDPYRFIHHSEPGGPSRILYLSEFQKKQPPIGMIIANGEKIGEWITWLTFVKFAVGENGRPALKAFEVTTSNPLIKEGVLMSTPYPYSIFNLEDPPPHIDISRLRSLDKPNHFRSMIVITPAGNNRVCTILANNSYREVSACL